MSEQILPTRVRVGAISALLAAVIGGCGLDADEETSTATTSAPIKVESGGTGPSGPTGLTGATGKSGEAEAPGEADLPAEAGSG